MKICTKCNTAAGDNMNFCSICGAPLTYVQPVQPQYSYNQPAPNRGGNIAMRIVSMVLSISGFSFLILGFLYTLIGLVEAEMAFAFAFVFALIFLPMCIVGLILSNKCNNNGDYSTPCRVAKGLGLAGIIVSGVSLFIGFIALMSEM